MLCLSASLVVALALTAPVSRDEHMYQAAADLLSRWRPYDQFVFPQPPLSAWSYAAVQAAWPGDQVLLPARLAHALACLLLGLVIWRLCRRLGADRLMAAALLLLLVHLEVVRAALGVAGNVLPALALSLVPWLLLPVGPDDQARWWRLVPAGSLAGLGLVCRLTHAPLMLVVVAWPLLVGGTRGVGWRRQVAWLALGAALPLVWVTVRLWGNDPTSLWFSLVDYHLLNARYHDLAGLGVGRDLAGKMHELGRLYRHTDLAAWSAVVAVSAVLMLVRGRGHLWRPGAVVMACGLVMLLVPRPLQTTYYVTLLAGGVLLVAAAGKLAGRTRKGLGCVLAVAVLVSVGHHAVRDGRVIAGAVRPSRWPAVQMHAAGVRLGAALGDVPGPVIATHPLYVLEAGRDLDPAFASGEFVWRLGTVLEGRHLPGVALVTADRLAEHAVARPPAGVVMVVVAPWDQPLGDWARARGWRAASVAGGVVAWRPEGGVK